MSRKYEHCVEGNTFGSRIRYHRRRLRYTQEEMAKKIGIHSSVLCGYENDLHVPTLYMAVCIADVLGMSLDYLTGRKVK